jgi:Flp pilus assembly protein TadD/predicted aspartyl protease
VAPWSRSACGLPRFGVGVFACVLSSLLAIYPACAFQTPDPDPAQQARTNLLAGRYDAAIDLYRKALIQDPAGDSYLGLTRALLKAHRSKEAYLIAQEALDRAPQTPGAQTAAGAAMVRQGDLTKAETYYRAALKLDPKYPGALTGLAFIYSSVSHNKTARALLLQAYAAAPNDPSLMLARANTLKGDEHIAALEAVLTLLDPESEEARGLRAHIALDRAVGGRKVRRLVSAYEPARIKFVHITNGPSRLRGFGLRVQFNQSYTGTLMLDTGASGIAIAPQAAQKAGLEVLGGQSSMAKGIGDKKAEDSFSYLASEVRIGEVVFADHPVSVFRTAKDSDIDGLIGADVFQKFIVTLDFPASQMSLEPHHTAPGDDPEDASQIAEGFHRIFRTGNHLLIPTSVNGSPAKLFLIDSGSSTNLIDSEAAREFTGVHEDSRLNVRGIQGKVDHVSRADKITLVFGGFRQENSDLIAFSLEKVSDASGIGITGVLGMPVLALLRLTIDYHEGAIRLERPKI